MAAYMSPNKQMKGNSKARKGKMATSGRHSKDGHSSGKSSTPMSTGPKRKKL